MKKENEVKCFLYGIPCYINLETYETRGRNWFYHKLLQLSVLIEKL